MTNIRQIRQVPTTNNFCLCLKISVLSFINKALKIKQSIHWGRLPQPTPPPPSLPGASCSIKYIYHLVNVLIIIQIPVNRQKGKIVLDILVYSLIRTFHGYFIQITFFKKSVLKIIGIIAKLRHFVPCHVLLTLYRSLILPYISSGICAWGHATETHLHKLLVLQKRALRLMFFAEPRTHAVPLFLETKQLPISFLLFEQMSLLMYDVHNNLAPDNIKNMFTKLSSVHSYRTRSVTNENYYVEQVRTENMKRAFSISGALIWNSIPLSIKTLKKNQFKSELKRKLFEILEKEDDYIRVSDITGQFSKS